MAALESLKGLVIIDEFQVRPALLNTLKVLADRPDAPAQFLILGSASPDIVKGASESLAGRVAFVDMSGFALDETGVDNWRTLWVRGGFPRPYLADSDETAGALREDFIRTFLERDLQVLGTSIHPETGRRFWTMLAHYHGQVWNGSEIGASMGISHHTTRRYLDILTGAFVIRQLQPCFINVGKRVVKSPKVYVRDSGLLHTLLGVSDFEGISSHPKLGASWEGFCIEQIIARVGERNVYFWGTHSGAELDLLLTHRGKHYGVEFKWGDVPRVTKSMHAAIETLSLQRLAVVYPGAERFALTDTIEAVPLTQVDAFLAELA